MQLRPYQEKAINDLFGWLQRHPLSALPDNWVELEQKQPSENEEVIIRFCGEPRIAVSAGEVVGGDELFFDFGFEYDPDFCSSHDKFMTTYSHEITQWQPLPELPQNKKKNIGTSSFN